MHVYVGAAMPIEVPRFPEHHALAAGIITVVMGIGKDGRMLLQTNKIESQGNSHTCFIERRDQVPGMAALASLSVTSEAAPVPGNEQLLVH